MKEFDISSAPLEIERKFLIRMPDMDILKAQKNYRVRHIEQSYLEKTALGRGGRIRRITENGKVSYIYTYKEKLSDITRREFEQEISEEEYRKLLRSRMKDSSTIVKDRHIFEYLGLTYELDVYSFWNDKATLEAEVDREETLIPIPAFLTLIKEVTHDKRYNNSHLAVNLGQIE